MEYAEREWVNGDRIYLKLQVKLKKNSFHFRYSALGSANCENSWPMCDSKKVDNKFLIGQVIKNTTNPNFILPLFTASEINLPDKLNGYKIE